MFKSATSDYDPAFWEKMIKLTCDSPILIIGDIQIASWKFESLESFQMLITETTGYPYWITDSEGGG